MPTPNIAKLARELAKFTKSESKSKLSDKLDASTETIQMGEDVLTMTPEQFEKTFNDAAGAISVAKLLKMLKSAKDGKDLSIKDSAKTYMKDEEVIDKQKLDEQEEIIRRITK